MMTVHVRPPVDGATTILIRRAGALAAEFCKNPVRAEVAAVFARSFYLRSGDLFVCVGEPAIRNGPLTLIADMRTARLGLHPGQPARIARRRLARLRSWLAASIVARDAPATALADSVRELAGLGPGLTPSGDDVLVGALALLDALADRHAGACAMRENLARAVSHIPSGLTSPLSRCFLRVAAAGHVGECLHAAVSSCLTADPDAAVAAIRDIGHSSGWDMMAGIVTALDAVTARNDLVYLAQGKST